MRTFILALTSFFFATSGAFAEAPTVTFDVQFDVEEQREDTVGIDLGVFKQEGLTLTLAEEDPGNAVNVDKYWTAEFTKETIEHEGENFDLSLFVAKTLYNDGTTDWWLQINVNNQNVAGVSADDISSLNSLIGSGPAVPAENVLLRPRTIVDVK